MRLAPVVLKSLPVCLAVTLSILLGGCTSDTYSDAIRYLVRTDPLVMDAENLGPERPEPDRPGQLPLMSAKDLLELPNPFYQNLADAEKANLVKTGKLRDPNLLTAVDRKNLQANLDQFFGSRPNRPRPGVDSEAIRKLRLDEQTLAKGSALYRVQCLHCHGVTGNGRGPTSRWVNPHPRDYRQGLFKFQSIDQVAGIRKPSRDDLMRTLVRGVEGTSMPSFGLLNHEDLELLVSYVIHLSIRGETEFQTLKNAYDYKVEANALVPRSSSEPLDTIESFVAKLGKDWVDAQDKAIVIEPKDDDPKSRAESVHRGHALFMAEDALLTKAFPAAKAADLNNLKGASCVKCHKDFGRQANFKFDSWGTLVRAANLTTGNYRGGSRPVDLYFRVHSGINGSGMVAFGSILKSEQIWDVVNFVRLLPYPEMLRKEFGINIR
ncbi:MAG: hypothetical protein FJ271_19605 [Planctomycetes bacterium]|nr:hypothetical protein [Planctomycetota bacterium]